MIILGNFELIRKNKQINNNNLVSNYLLKPDLSLEELNSVINPLELQRLLIALNLEFELFRLKCFQDEAFRTVVSSNISKLASRQADERFLLSVINNVTKEFGVYVSRPQVALNIFDEDIRAEKKLPTSKFRSLDAISHGKLDSFIFCKIILGTGSTQTNSWAEATDLILWAIRFDFKKNLILLIDSDNIAMLRRLKKLAVMQKNIKVFSYIQFQQWVEENTVK